MPPGGLGGEYPHPETNNHNKKMKCSICNEDMEYFGSILEIEDKEKYKKDFGVCTKHIPYTPITLTNKSLVLE